MTTSAVARFALRKALSLHILLAEDDISNQLVTKRILEGHGHLVTVVANGRQAVEAMELFRYDIVLMDIQMPVMDGISATMEIRKSEEEKGFRTPIIALTSFAADQMFASAGMDGYLRKPAKAEELLALLESFSQLSNTKGED